MIEIWFVTPAFRRLELSELCFDQRRRLCDELAEAGIRANCVVVADDENLELARERGFDAVEQGNKWLGAKFAVGYRHALRRGATHLMPVGSDSWIHAGLIRSLPFHNDACTGTRFLSTLRPDGRERLDLRIEYAAGFGVATLYPRAAIGSEPWPCQPQIKRGCDTSTWNRCARDKFPIDFASWHRLEYTDFKSYDVQTTDYARLKLRHDFRLSFGDGAIDGLLELWPADLVDRLRAIYSDRPAWTD